MGQYVSFTALVGVSLIGFALAQAIPSEPIGFLGLVITLIGFWMAFDNISTWRVKRSVDSRDS